MSIIINPLTGFASERFGVAVGPLQVNSDLNLAGQTIVARYAAKIIKASGTKIRLILRGCVGDNTGKINNVTISRVATTSGSHPWDSIATPIAVTFRGSNIVSLTRGSTAVSDDIPFTIDPAGHILIAYNLAAGAYASIAQGLNASQYVMYRKVGVTEAATANRGASYITSTGCSPFLTQIQCWS